MDAFFEPSSVCVMLKAISLPTSRVRRYSLDENAWGLGY